MTARMSMGFIFCIIAMPAHAARDDCILIFEGEVNEIMEPEHTFEAISPGYTFSFSIWHAVDERGIRNGLTFTTDYRSPKYIIDKIGYTSKDVMNFTGLADCPGQSPFQLLSTDTDTGKEYTVAIVYVAEPPLNTLCRPNKGIIQNAKSGERLGETHTIYECASLMVQRRAGLVAVQWSGGIDQECIGFAGVSTFIEQPVNSNSLACLLQCNPVSFIGDVETDASEKAETLNDCEAIGLKQSGESISFDPQLQTCRLYKSGVKKLINSAYKGCYLPPYPPPTTTTTTTITTQLTESQKSTLSAGEKAAIGIVVGVISAAGVGAAAYTLSGGDVCEIFDILKDVMPSKDSAMNKVNVSTPIEHFPVEDIGNDIDLNREQFVNTYGSCNDYYY